MAREIDLHGPFERIVRIVIIGTGLIGASIGLALRHCGFSGSITGIDNNPAELETALSMGALTHAAETPETGLPAIIEADLIVLCVPVLAILDWMERLVPVTAPHQLITDVGSTKSRIADSAARLFNQPGRARFLPGHPMAGKESGGAALAEASLLEGATWLFTPTAIEERTESGTPLSLEDTWRILLERCGCRLIDLTPERHDTICASVSHLPQMLSTALAAMLEETIAGEPGLRQHFRSIGGRALRETTRLGASPYSMWRDVALTNTEPLAATLLALEQRLQHMRENLRTPELREEFRLANAFRAAPID